MRNKKTIILLLLIAIVGVVGLTLAYFANTASVENVFNTKQYGTTVDEVFTSPDDWTPGTTTPKTLTVTNSGQVDEAVRVSYTETWTSKNSNEEGDLSLTQGNNRAAIINFSDNEDWTPVTESDNKTYYYYNYKLAPNETTSTLLDSVTFNSAITNDSNCVTTTDSETHTKTITCDSTGNGYDGATYKLVFKVETVQYDKYADAWGTGASIANSSKPLMLKGLKYNALDKTYENGDRSAMFAFSHPETEQMKATTDYRYIGNVPNNYVKFNCDNDGTNCELWRIIGVFEVDDGNGNYQQRIKLVRGSAFADVMQWDDRGEIDEVYGRSLGVNEWDGAKLNIFLNGDYLTGNGISSSYSLKQLAQLQIADAKYYLGGRTYDSTTHYGSAEEMYSWERGTEVYNKNGATRSVVWIGKVGLLYPSDIYMTYANGVDTNCYNDPSQCASWGSPAGSPVRGWLYNSYNLENQEKPYLNWLLSPSANESTSVFCLDVAIYSSNYGSLSENGGVRPVVYLKSSINITSGEGTEQNPYILG